MGIKTKIKKLFEQKAYLPISHPVSIEKEFECELCKKVTLNAIMDSKTS